MRRCYAAALVVLVALLATVDASLYGVSEEESIVEGTLAGDVQNWAILVENYILHVSESSQPAAAHSSAPKSNTGTRISMSSLRRAAHALERRCRRRWQRRPIE